MKPIPPSLILFTILSLAAASPVAATNAPAPVKIIFDTDIGNDVDDALALGLLHSLQTRGACELLCVTITRCDELAGPYVDAMNRFYGRPLPVGCIRSTPEGDTSKYLPLVQTRDGDAFRYPHTLQRSSDAPDALKLLRRLLAAQPDGSVTLVQVGYFSNFAALLDTPADDISPLKGVELVRRKVKLLSVMAGAFQTIEDNNRFCEFNVYKDIPASQKLAREWPTPIVWSGVEIGIALPYPAVSIEQDYRYVPHHPIAESYFAFMPPPHERPTWDLTSALYAVLPERGYFGLSAPGAVTVEADGFTRFSPKAGGRDRFLKLDTTQRARTLEALVQLCVEPPPRIGK
ncbi:MAG: nucleoside hydrolase [Verrucomicrobia subdivision 3 bacterium]|nr:nucleoside hydrolase [Limisphaerales bacterium]